MLSWMLLEGECIPPDPTEAYRWATAAAGQGVASAMTGIGTLYHDAVAVERDPVEAARWWRRGAERGDADGQAMLGAACTIGSGVARDPVAGLAWLLRAQAGGSTLAAVFLPAARAALDADGVAEAERRVAAPLPEAAA